jgi:DNA replication protein DnaC
MAVSCSKCGDSGWIIVEKDGREQAVRCTCSQKQAALTHAESANIPRRFIGCRLKGFMAHEDAPSLAKAKKTVNKFITDYPAVDKGLLFHGPVGVGKTRLLCTVASELLVRYPSLDVYYIDWNDLVRTMRSGEDSQSRNFQQINEVITRLTECDLLIFDEFGASKVSAWVQDQIYYVVNHRYNQQKVTLVATNFFDQSGDGQETLTERVGDRLRSRLHEMTLSIEIFGVDYRRQYC